MGINNSALYFMGARFIFVLSAYTLHIFAAYYFDDPQVYGNLSVALSINAIGMIFIQFGFPQAISKFISENQDDGDGVFVEGRRTFLKFSIIVFVVYIACIPVWVYIVKDISLYYILAISSLLIPIFSFNGAYMSYLNGKQRFKEQSFFVSLYPVTRIILSLFFVVCGFGVAGIFMGFVFAGLINSFFLHQKIHIDSYYDRKYSSKLVKFAFPIVMLSIGIALYMNIDVVIVKHFFPDDPVVGFYAASSNIAKIPYYIYFAYAMTILPIVSKNVANNNFDCAIKSIKRCVISLLILIAVSSIFVGIFSERIIDCIYPEGYSRLSNIMSILFFSMGILALYQALSSILIALGKIIISTIVIFVVFILELFICVVYIPKYGIIGMAMANLLPVLLGVIILACILKHYMHDYIHVGIVPA